MAERQAARASTAAGNRAQGIAPQHERHELTPTGDKRAWRVVLVLMVVLAVVVGLLA